MADAVSRLGDHIRIARKRRGMTLYEGDLQIGTFAYGRKYPERKNALRTTTPGTTDFFSVLPEWRCPRPMTSCRL